MTAAAIDIGSMSTRLLVRSDDGTTTRREVITRLGEGLIDGEPFAPEALDRVAAALTGFLDDVEGCSEVTVVATSAARRARSVDPLAQVVRNTLGRELVVLDGEVEGRLAFAGATADVAPETTVLVIDIGGGSTEFTIGTSVGGPSGSWSAEIGALRVVDQFLASDPPHPAELSAALSVVELHLTDVLRELPAVASLLAGNGLVVGVGGTITTTAAVEIGLQVWDPTAVHGLELERPAVEDVFRTLATESAEDRAFNPGLPAERVGAIVGGLCILAEVMRTFGLASITTSVSDLLDGVLAAPELVVDGTR